MAVRTVGAKYTHLTDVFKRIGRVPANRIRVNPPPGLATEADLFRLVEGEPKCLCELVDGILVEKPVRADETHVAMRLGAKLDTFVEDHDLGLTLGADGTLKILPGLVRLPDISYLSWETLPDRKMTGRPIPELAPDLAVEVLSRSNTRSEMRQKLKDYFLAGVREVWFIDPSKRDGELFRSPEESRRLTAADRIESESLLPGFSVRLGDLFRHLPDSPINKKSARKGR